MKQTYKQAFYEAASIAKNAMDALEDTITDYECENALLRNALEEAFEALCQGDDWCANKHARETISKALEAAKGENNVRNI